MKLELNLNDNEISEMIDDFFNAEKERKETQIHNFKLLDDFFHSVNQFNGYIPINKHKITPAILFAFYQQIICKKDGFEYINILLNKEEQLICTEFLKSHDVDWLEIFTDYLNYVNDNQLKNTTEVFQLNRISNPYYFYIRYLLEKLADKKLIIIGNENDYLNSDKIILDNLNDCLFESNLAYSNEFGYRHSLHIWCLKRHELFLINFEHLLHHIQIQLEKQNDNSDILQKIIQNISNINPTMKSNNIDVLNHYQTPMFYIHLEKLLKLINEL